MKSRLMRAIALGALTMAAIPVSNASRGDVDPGFGKDGLVQVSADRLDSLPDGSLIAVTLLQNSTSLNSKGVVVSHWDVNGVPDPAFGPEGSRQIAVPILTYPGMATRTADGKFYIWGALTEVRQSYQINDMAIIRLNADGTLDPSFGVGGVLSRPAAPYAVNDVGFGDVVASLIVEPDGHLLVCDAEFEDYYGLSNSVTIRKYDPSGAADPTFGAGTGATQLPGDVSVFPFFTSLSLTGTGLIRLVSASSSFVYLNPDGSPAPAPVNYAGLRSDVAAWGFAGDLANGDTLIAGESAGGAAVVARVHADGTLETSFGGSGTGYAQFPGRTLVSPYYSAHSTFLSADGHRLYVSLSPSNPSGTGVALARLAVDGPAAGTLDLGFSASGLVELDEDWLQVDGVVEQTTGAVLVTTYWDSAIRLLPVDSASPGFIGIGGISNSPGQPFAGPTTAYVTVSRIAGKNGAISLNYSTSDMDAIAGVNYRATAGTLTWADGDFSDRTVAIGILADQGSSLAGYKQFSLNLDVVQGGTFVFHPNIELAVAVPQTVVQPPTPQPPPTNAASASAGNGGGGAMDVALLVLLAGTFCAKRRRRWRNQP